MKSLYLLFIGLIGVLSGCQQTSKNNDLLVAELDSLFRHYEIFQANRLFDKVKYKLPQIDCLIFSSKLENSFNNPASSNSSIVKLLKHYSTQLSEKTKHDLYKIKLQNHVRLFEYSQAADVTIELVENYDDYLDSMEIIDLKNELNIWNGLRNQPPQLLTKKKHSKIHLIDGSRIPTIFNNSNTSVNMIFDTGANISVIIESLAKSLEMKYLDSSVNIKGILGNDILAKVALASSMSFGNIELSNVVLLVFPDSALYFPEADFQIYGITGYPVISALGEIQRTRNNELIIPSETSKNPYSNLAMDYLTPLVEVVNEKDSLIFTFDTGASKTWLYEKYYKRNDTSIKLKSKKTEITLGGVGSVNKYQVFLIDFPLNIGETYLKLDSTILFPENINSEHDKYSGNIGQDVVKSFDKMTLNFEDMFIQFSNY